MTLLTYADYVPWRWIELEVPTFNAPSKVIPFVLVPQPEQHHGPMELVNSTDCARCQWAARRGALGAHVMMRETAYTGQTMFYTSGTGLPTAKYIPEDT